MGQFTPDVAISVDDRHAAAKHYEEVFGLKRGREGAEWIEMFAGPFSFFLTEEEPTTSAMFAFATDNLEATVARIIVEGGEEVSRKGGEVFVRDRYGLPICIEKINELD